MDGQTQNPAPGAELKPGTKRLATEVVRLLVAIDDQSSPEDVRELASEALAVLQVTDVRALKSIFVPEGLRALLRSMLAKHPENRPAPSEIRRAASIELELMEAAAARRESALTHFRATPREIARAQPRVQLSDRTGNIYVVALSTSLIPAIVLKSLVGFGRTAAAIFLVLLLLVGTTRRARRRLENLFEDGEVVLGEIEELNLSPTRNEVKYSFDYGGRRYRGKLSLALIIPGDHYPGAQLAVFVDRDNAENHAPMPVFYRDQRTMPR